MSMYIRLRHVMLTDVQWMLVSPDYLKSRKNILSWQSFLQKLGVHNKIAVRQFNERVPEVSLIHCMYQYSNESVVYGGNRYYIRVRVHETEQAMSIYMYIYMHSSSNYAVLNLLSG